MTPLGRKIAERIAAAGPIGLAEYMGECLLHPTLGYYTTRDPLGRTGDFTTAPEISQMFGECLGLCLVQAWLDQGAPGRIVLAELGPGRGTLMADILRAARVLPAFRAAVEVHLVEASPTLRQRQAETLAPVTGATPPHWHDRLDTLPDAPLFLVANEFLDALPIRQFQREANGWRERVVGLKDGQLALGLTAPAPVAALEHRIADTKPGDIVELCPALPAVVGDVACRIARNGGAALFVDYGNWRSFGDTLQAVRAHAFDDPLAHPGEADLTAHVDFEAVAIAARAAGAEASAMVPQGELLARLGIAARYEALARNLSGAALENHLAAFRRLTAPEEMGRLFQAIALHPRGGPVPPGFA